MENGKSIFPHDAPEGSGFLFHWSYPPFGSFYKARITLAFIREKPQFYTYLGIDNPSILCIGDFLAQSRAFRFGNK